MASPYAYFVYNIQLVNMMMAVKRERERVRVCERERVVMLVFS